MRRKTFLESTESYHDDVDFLVGVDLFLQICDRFSLVVALLLEPLERDVKPEILEVLR